MIGALLAAMLAAPAPIEPQPLPEGQLDSGINVLLDSGHQFNFFTHWSVQGAIRNRGHRVTGNQASLHLALTPGTPMVVRAQASHEWGTHRPFGTVPAPIYDVLYTYQLGEAQPYLAEERAALRAYLEQGGGAILVPGPGSALAEVTAELGATLVTEPLTGAVAEVELPALTGAPESLRAAELGEGWEVLLGAGRRAALARRTLGRGTILLVADERLLHQRAGERDQPHAELLDWLVRNATSGARNLTDERRVPWEHGGLGGAFYPEQEMQVGGVRVQYAGNQRPDIIDLAKTRFPAVMAALQRMLPTPPNPGEAFYINLAAGAGGGWAENAITPKLAGTIALDHDGILSVLAHELAHTMYGPEAHDGTAGCQLPGWWSEAHAGWFQRKVGRELGFGQGWPYHPRSLALADPLLDALDLSNIPDGAMGRAWDKAWLLWSILDARYGGDWYAKWLAHVHRKFNDPRRALTMDEYVISISETVGEDVGPLFRRFGTPVEARVELPPIAPRL